MEELILYRDKKESFKSTLNIEGARLSESTIRLCLESSNGYNLYFNGSIDSTGNCTIDVPPLKVLDEGLTGKAIIEVVADNSFFKVYETTYKVKSSVKVVFEMVQTQKDSNDKPAVSFSLTESVEKPIVEEPTLIHEVEDSEDDKKLQELYKRLQQLSGNKKVVLVDKQKK